MAVATPIMCFNEEIVPQVSHTHIAFGRFLLPREKLL